MSTVVRLSTDAGVVVAYEADDLDPQRRAGWSVVVTGWASMITDPEQIARSMTYWVSPTRMLRYRQSIPMPVGDG